MRVGQMNGHVPLCPPWHHRPFVRGGTQPTGSSWINTILLRYGDATAGTIFDSFDVVHTPKCGVQHRYRKRGIERRSPRRHFFGMLSHVALNTLDEIPIVLLHL